MPARPDQRSWTRYLSTFDTVLRAHRPLLAMLVLYFVVSLLVAEYFGMPGHVSPAHYALVVPYVTAAYLIGFVLLYLIFVMTVIRPTRLLAHIAKDARARWLDAERITGGVLIVVVLQMFFSVFTSMKSMIPVINPFAWDATLAAWDRAMHGGIDPWLLMQPMIGFPLATTGINFLYQCWLFIVYGFLVWQAFSLADHRLRMQFFLSLILVWTLLGNLAATLLSSAGPVYFGRITGLDDPFVPLMDYLKAANEVSPVWALEVQDRLWTAFAEDKDALGKGISAMPSIHVAMAVIFALVAWRAHRLAGLVFIFYAAVVMVGSVHLGWHYALDGYVSILATYLLWRVAGWLVAADSAFTAGLRAADAIEPPGVEPRLLP